MDFVVILWSMWAFASDFNINILVPLIRKTAESANYGFISKKGANAVKMILRRNERN